MTFDISCYEKTCVAVRHKIVLGHELVLAADKSGFVFFTVDDSSYIKDSISIPTGAVLLRWAFNAWADILSNELNLMREKYFCFLVNADGAGSRRRKALLKAGFISSKKIGADMEYHNQSPFEEVA